jgi:hypothetical protein
VTPIFRWTLLWIGGSVLMVFAALSMVTSSFDGQEYLPNNPDAFYHARRILDSVFSGEPVIQFDPRIHVPEGSWLAWPWGFDTLMAWITQAFGPFADRAAANRVLMNIPPAASVIAVALVVNIARQLRLPMLLATLLVVAFAALPTAYMPFAVGNVDHHFAELLWALGTLSAGIWFFTPGSSSPASGITLGCVLGSALAIHNSLFILMVPVALMMAIAWLRGAPPPDRARLLGFSISLLIVTTLVCIPSQPWRRGFFEFYTLSWFHFHVSACVAVFSAALGWLPRSGRNIALLSIASLAALAPLIGSLDLAGEFVTGKLEIIRDITEVVSPYEMFRRFGESMSMRLLSGLMWLTAPMLLLNAWWVYRERAPEIQYVAVAGVLGLGLMQMQFRFAVIGEIHMLLTPVLLAKMISERIPQRRIEAMLGCALLLGFAFYPTLKNWRPLWTLGGDRAYEWVRPVFPTLRTLCDQQRGVVLADLDAGHWARYHSECSVIGNVFLLTPQHAVKAHETARLLGLSPQQLMRESPEIRYVLARHSTRLFLGQDGKEGPVLESLREKLPALERDLLGPASSLPPQYRIRAEALTPAGQTYARVLEIVHSP